MDTARVIKFLQDHLAKQSINIEQAVILSDEVWLPVPTKPDKPEHVVIYAAIERTSKHVFWRSKINYEVIPGLSNVAGIIHHDEMRIARPTPSGDPHPSEWKVSPGIARQILSLDKTQPVIVRMSGFTEDGKSWLEDRYDL